MNRLLGRGKSPGPSKNWVLSTLVALVLAFVAWIGIFTYQSVEVWTPLQQWYWVQYSISKDFPNPSGTYQVLSKLDRQGQHSMATDADVMPAPLEIWPSFALTAKARQAGAVALKVDTVHYTSAQMNRMLAELIYAGQTPGDLLLACVGRGIGSFCAWAVTRRSQGTGHDGTSKKMDAGSRAQRWSPSRNSIDGVERMELAS